MDTTSPITLAVVDDHALVREGLCNMLAYMGFSVIMQAEHGQDLLTQLTHASSVPTVCLLDINMPVMNGMETTVAIKRQWPEIKVVGYTFNSSQADAMLQSGADACLQKCRSLSEIKDTILGLIVPA